MLVSPSLVQIEARVQIRLYFRDGVAVAPWFSPSKWGGGGYLAVHNSVGSLIDWVSSLLVTTIHTLP